MIKRSLCLLAALLMAVSFGTPAFAASSGDDVPTADSSRVVWVTDYGADGSDKKDDAGAIQEALDLGKSATEDAPVTVIVPAGTYYIKSKLYIYSNTTLQLDPEAVIVRGKEKTQMLTSGYRNSGVGGYEQLKNVTITGGVWDGNVKTNAEGRGSNAYNLFFLWHGDNITIRDTTLKNCCGDHFIELSGVANSRIENVTFQDFIKYTRTNYDYVKEDPSDSQTAVRSEAIQLDYTIYGNSTPAKPYDWTVCRNITIRGCRFINCIAGIGSHHAGAQARDIIITGNSFENMESACISLPNMANVTINGNTATNVRAFLRATDGTHDVTVSDNTIIYGFDSVGDTLRQDCFFISNASVVLKDNRIYGCGNHAVYGSGSSCRLTLENNVFDLSSFRPEDTSAIRTESAAITASGNVVTGAGQDGFSLRGSTGTLSNNRVAASGQYGILLDSSSFQVTGNIIDSGLQWAVRISGASSGTVTGNSLTGLGIENDSSHRVTLEDNRLTLPAPVLTDAAVVTGGVELRWDPVPGLTRYRVFYKTDSRWETAGDTEETRFLWNGAESGVHYRFTVRGLDESGGYASAYDPEGLSLTVPLSLPAPRITRAAGTDAGIEIQWEAVEGAAGYRVFFRTDSGDWQAAGDTEAPGFLWTGAEGGVHYRLSVRCLDESGECVSPYSGSQVSILVLSPQL